MVALRKIKLISIAICLMALAKVHSQSTNIEEKNRLEWFQDAKLGIFIHWGYYGVNGIAESWSLYHKKISYENYMAQGNKFTAKNYDPEKWANLFKKTGAR